MVHIIKHLQLDKSRTRIGIYPNIPWDGAMLRKSPAFPTMNSFAKAIIEWATQNPSIDLIIRCHPVEAKSAKEKSSEGFMDVMYMESASLPNNIKHIAPDCPISSYQLSQICNASLMYASTLSNEFAMAKHPVIQTGLIHISNKDLVLL